MGRIVFLLEEESMAETLRQLLPKIFSGWQENIDWIAIPHRGKSDLEKSIPRKVRGWNEPDTRFVVLRDNDGGNCLQRKAKLRELAGNRPKEVVLIRIVCQELESWLLGDLAAIKAAFPRAPIKEGAVPAKYRQPDALANAAEELLKLTRAHGKISRARAIAEYMQPRHNRSQSFQIFLSGLSSLVTV